MPQFQTLTHAKMLRLMAFLCQREADLAANPKQVLLPLPPEEGKEAMVEVQLGGLRGRPIPLPSTRQYPLSDALREVWIHLYDSQTLTGRAKPLMVVNIKRDGPDWAVRTQGYNTEVTNFLTKLRIES